MAKRIGDGPTTLPLQQPLTTQVSSGPVAKPSSAQRAAQVKAKPSISQTNTVDSTEAASPADRTSTEGLRNQVKAGLVRLEANYYGPTGGEPSFLKLIGSATEQESVPDHVLAHQSKLFQKDLGLSPEESRALVADLALVLA